MKKEEIYVKIDSEEKRLRAIEILEKANTTVRRTSHLYSFVSVYKYLAMDSAGIWTMFCVTHKTEITLDQLEALLLPNYQVKDVVLSLDELKQQAEKLGYVLVEKPYEPKVGDFGVFWDDEEVNSTIGFVTEIDSSFTPYKVNNYEWWQKFRKLTEEEKQKIQESW